MKRPDSNSVPKSIYGNYPVTDDAAFQRGEMIVALVLVLVIFGVPLLFTCGGR